MYSLFVLLLLEIKNSSIHIKRFLNTVSKIEIRIINYYITVSRIFVSSPPRRARVTKQLMAGKREKTADCTHSTPVMCPLRQNQVNGTCLEPVRDGGYL